MPQSDVMSLMVILSIFLCWRSFLRDASKASFVVFDMDFSSFQFLLKNMFKNITGISYLYGGNSLFISRLYIQANQQGQTHLSTFKAPFLYYNVPDTKQKCGNMLWINSRFFILCEIFIQRLSEGIRILLQILCRREFSFLRNLQISIRQNE